MRLKSLDLDQPDASRDELIALADLLRAAGLTVEIAARGESTRTRMRESADRAFVDILNVVLDESERHGIDVVITAVTTWAVQRLHFRRRSNARPVLVIWVGDEDVRTVPLPDPKRDIARIRNTDHWPAKPWLPLVRLDDGDVECAFIYDEDVVSDEAIRLFGATPHSEQALMAGTLVDGSQLPLIGEYDSLERLLADGWSVD
ncbi:MAG: hypothetical protein ACYC91_15495 [Solirubrobacteraceae bacterium]